MLSNELELCVQDAFNQAREARHEYLTVEHLLLCILATPRVREILHACGAGFETLSQELKTLIDQSTPRLEEGEDREVQPTLGFQRVLQRAVFHVQSSGKKEVGVANVLVALFSEKESHAVALLASQSVTRLDVVNYLSHGVAKVRQETAEPGEPFDLDNAAQALLQQAAAGTGADGDRALMRFLDRLMDRALQEHASAVHIEPFIGRLVIRFRIPEGLREVLQQPRGLAPLLVRGIKRIAGLDPDSALPQDTRITLKDKGRVLGLTVATLPSRMGERVVLHFEEAYSNFTSLGMDATTAQQLEALLGKPGLVLVTGPAGSGRTTALYTALARLDERRLNIMTVEDHVGRSFDGISQTEVTAPLTSGQALAAVLRHAPDVVMIDELRDGAILPAVKLSAQRQVLASLKAPTATAALTSLMMLGVAPALLAPVVNGVLALRLARRLDPATRQAYRAEEADRELLGLQPGDPSPEIYRAGGDEGYRGTTGFHELLVVDDALRRLIGAGASAQALEQHARGRSVSPLVSLWAAARAKVLSGETSVEEAVRVLGDL